MDWRTHINNIHRGGCCLTVSLDLKRKDYQITGNPCLKNFWVLHNNIHVKCPFSFPQCAILDILERLLWWVLGHEKFRNHPLLLLKICLLLWATLLFMHCSCMLMEERSIHRLILQYFATVNNYK